MTLYDLIKKIASERGKTIAAIEKEAGIANGTISGWKNGKPYFDTLKKVADVLDYNLDKLISEVTE